MNLIWRTRILGGLAALFAVFLAWQIAEGDFAWPVIAGAVGTGAILFYFLRVPIDVVTIGVLLFGYLVGNRGFAQLMPSPRLPLLPAELGLLIAGGWLLVRSALDQSLPLRRTLVDVVLIALLALGTSRVVIDIREFGVMALRDFAMIYYVAFFFIARSMATEPRWRAFLLRSLVAASVALPLAFLLFETFPEFVFNSLAVRGVPLIFFKGDLAATFMAVSAIVLFLTAGKNHRWWAWPVATAEFVYVVIGENRASMLGALIGLVWLSLRARLFPVVQTAALVAGLVVLIGLAKFAEHDWAVRRLHGLEERVISLVDFSGHRRYVSDESAVKGDNNRFRAIWWQTVIDETLAANPVFGLGFGYDLARGFLQQYNPEIGDDFIARSPHSILVTVFGRLGFVGLGLFLLLCVLLALRTWRVMRDREARPPALALWASVWVILVSACFGVVLEGPMGAVVFWTLLGLASGWPAGPSEPAQSDAAPAPHLRAAATADQLAPAS